MTQTVGERLKISREKAGLSQQQLADQIGATRSAIAQVEGGTSNSLNAENLAKAARALRKNAVWLATGEGPETDVGALGETLGALTEEDRQQVFDFILYKIERTPVPYMAKETAKSYGDMIERMKADMAKKRNGDK